MKIFGHPMSTCTRKVLATLAEKQVKPEFVMVDVMTGANKAPEYMSAHQPFGQVPALEDGDFRLYESRAIIRYLDQTLPGTSLTPQDAKGRALMEQWISVETSNFTPYAMTIIFQQVFTTMRGGQPDMAKVAEGRTKLAPAVGVLEKHLARGPHLLGAAFTLADICFMPYIEYLMASPSKDVIEGSPNVLGWWKRISERPSWKQVTAKA
jgi:glutathione S-transferase